MFPKAPLTYAIELTYACNNFCSGCANVWEPHRHITLRHWQRLLDIVAPPEERGRYAQFLRITGGEPTLHRDFDEIIQYIDTFGVKHTLFTTGRWQKPERIIQRYLACDNFIGMLVSLHGSTPAVHNAFVESVDHAFEETCTNIERATQAGVEVFTNAVLTKHSCDQIKEIIALSQSLGASHTIFNRFMGGGHPLDPTEEQLREAILQVEALQTNGAACHLGSCVPPCFVENSTDGSNGGIEGCIISPLGQVRPDNLTSQVFGNIFESSIEEIWQSPKAAWYREQLPEACLECVELSRCRGGSKSVAIEHGLAQDRLMKEPIRKLVEEELILDPDWKPQANFMLREESFGYLVARYNWSIPVSAEAKPLLDAIDGQTTLFQIQKRFGDEGLALIGHLYREKCITFVEL